MNGVRDARYLHRGELTVEERAALVHTGLCYKVVAQGTDGVGELDLFLYTASGVLAQQDTTTGTGAILGTAQPLCPEDPVEYRVELRGRGAGEVAAQLYASP